jgi:deoxyadenosine/deoxycytidine kinase
VLCEALAKQLVVVAGNIGSGKTTLAAALARRLNWRCELEAVSENPYLADFYNDMKSWSLHVQFHFLASRACQHRSACTSNHSTILDRSIYEDAHVFVAALRKLGQISDRDFQTYSRVFEIISLSLKPPTLIIYLRAPTETLLRRILVRGRVFEKTISLEYLETISSFYENWTQSLQFCPILTIDSNMTDFNEIHQISKIAEDVLLLLGETAGVVHGE